MKKRHSRMIFVTLLITGISLAGYFATKAFEENMLYFFSPSDVVEGKAPDGRSFRLGGMVEMGSVSRDGINSTFNVTDTKNKFTIKYTGILPDLFREGQGIITTGKLVNGEFMASEVLAKHDENYMPPEVADAMERAKKNKTPSTSKYNN